MAALPDPTTTTHRAGHEAAAARGDMGAAPGALARPSPTLTFAALAACDLIALFMAVAVAEVTVGMVVPPAPSTAIGVLGVPVLFLLAYAIAGMYPAVGLNPVDELRRATLSTLAVVVVALAGSALLGASDATWLLVVVGATAIVTVPGCRMATRETFARRRWWGVPVVVLGAGRTAEAVIERLQAHPAVGMRPVACLDDDPTMAGRYVRGVPVVGPLAEAERVAGRGVRHAVVALPGLDPEEGARLIDRYGQNFPTMVLEPDRFGLPSVGIGTRDVGGALALAVRHTSYRSVHRAAKVCLDAALLLPTLVVGLPIIALAAVAVMIVSPGNPFYAQPREGRGGRIIPVWKIRTMYRDADAMLVRYLAENPAAREQWERHYKLEHDPRILPVIGGLLRSTSIDELPQLINVLRGDMSFVGPRPFPRYHLDAFSDEFRALRSSVRPGITGLWQVTARADGDLRVQEETDTYYVRNWSIWMDLYVLARTPIAVVSTKGAR